MGGSRRWVDHKGEEGGGVWSFCSLIFHSKGRNNLCYLGIMGGTTLCRLVMSPGASVHVRMNIH